MIEAKKVINFINCIKGCDRDSSRADLISDTIIEEYYEKNP